MHIIALSGSQGSGKTTTLNALSNNLPQERWDGNFLISDFKVARSLLISENITLEEAYATPESTIWFQDELLDRKYAYERTYANKGITGCLVVERSYADLFAYSLVYLGRYNKYSKWLDDYYKKCMEYQQLYSTTFYLAAGYFEVEHDGVRGSNRHYSTHVDLTLRNVVSDITPPSKLVIIDNPYLDYRVERIKTIINTLTEKGHNND